MSFGDITNEPETADETELRKLRSENAELRKYVLTDKASMHLASQFARKSGWLTDQPMITAYTWALDVIKMARGTK